MAAENNPFLTPATERGALTPRDSTIPMAAEAAPLYSEKGPVEPQRRSLLRRPICWVITAVIVVIVVVAVVVPVVLVTGKHHKSSGSSSGGSSGGKPSSNPQSPTGAITGGDGSTVVSSNGTSFTYKNQFGGFWYQDPNNPFAYNAQPNSWTKPLNQSWDWVNDKIYG
jgi:glucan 1,3-beta-glucosidase